MHCRAVVGAVCGGMFRHLCGSYYEDAAAMAILTFPCIDYPKSLVRFYCATHYIEITKHSWKYGSLYECILYIHLTKIYLFLSYLCNEIITMNSVVLLQILN